MTSSTSTDGIAATVPDMTELPGLDELTANQYAVADAAEAAANASPASGWTAGQVCAHLILNNGLFVEVARQVQQGHAPAYDNERSVADDATSALAAAAGSTAQVAEWLRQSAAGYAGFLAGLDQRVLDTQVPTTIRHEGGFMVNGEDRRLGDLMLGQLTFHAGMHLDQVRGLGATPSSPH
jgi:hypothetical protein